MMKNRALAGLAGARDCDDPDGVLRHARISDDGKDNAQTTTASGDAAKTPASEPAKPAEDVATVASEKMGRLKADAEKAAQALVSLFADGKVPAAEAYAGAKAEAERRLPLSPPSTSPEALEASLKETMTAARSSAEKALALLKALPSDPAAAGAAIGKVVDALAGRRRRRRKPRPRRHRQRRSSRLRPMHR